MRSRTVRVALLVLFAASLGAVGFQVWSLERQRTAAEQALQAFETRAGRVIVSLNELQASQEAYVAAGQGNEYWISRVGQIVERIDGDLVQLKQTAGDQATATAIGSAAQVMDNFVDLDKRVQEYTRGGQTLMASDIIFTDGLDMARTAGRHVDAARGQERSARAQAIAGLRIQQAYYAVGGVSAACLITLLLALAGPERQKAEAPEEAGDDTVRGITDELSPRLRSDAAGTASPAAGARAKPERPAETPALADVAELCTDLARVLDARQLPALMERVASLLDAAGVIVWMADPAGRELQPVLAHGYSESAIARMGAIPVASDNATAAAYRERKLETVKSFGQANGAIVTPLVVGQSCVGVMAAEIRGGGESRDFLQGLARILAAQLAGLLATAPQVEPLKAQA